MLLYMTTLVKHMSVPSRLSRLSQSHDIHYEVSLDILYTPGCAAVTKATAWTKQPSPQLIRCLHVKQYAQHNGKYKNVKDWRNKAGACPNRTSAGHFRRNPLTMQADRGIVHTK